MSARFQLLGDVEAVIDGRPVDVGHARQRSVLVALLIEENRVVPVDQLMDRAWAGRLPHHARNSLSGYVSRLRHAFAAADDVHIARQPGGYLLTVDPMAVDLHRFHGLLTQARDAAEGDDAIALYAQALGLWQGEAFATLDTPWLNSVRDALDADRLAAELDHNALVLERGQHTRLLGGLSKRAAEYPLDERVAGQFMLTLYRCGRQADALHHYQQVRVRLAEELGADPSLPLSELHQQILAADPRLNPGTPRHMASPVPRQLPVPPRFFAGRARELAELDSVPGNDDPAGALICGVFGAPGVGKTALAVHWAHRVAGRFPDGQLYVDLRGFDASAPAMSPAEAVRVFLDALGVSPQRIPASLDAQVGLYRSLLATKRVLVLLDNARSVEQVRPLPPGAPDCLVVVTSRSQLTGLLAAEGAHPLTLNLPTVAEAVDLLARRLGRDRVAADPEAVQEIIARCGRLPLALAVVAARAITRPDFPLHALASELGDSRGGLSSLSGGDAATDVRAVFSWSYHALRPAAAQLFRLISLHPGSDIAVSAAASLVGTTVFAVRPMLAELTGAHLANEHTPGRYAVHDLLRAYARELTEAHDSASEQRAVTHRILDHYLYTAHEAALLLSPQSEPIDLAPPRAGVSLNPVANHRQALAWFTTEHPALLSAVDLATRTGFDTHTWQLTWTLAGYLDRCGQWQDWAAVQRTALAAARRLSDHAGQAYAIRCLAMAAVQIGCCDNADTVLRQADALHDLATGGAENCRHDDIETILRHTVDLFGELGNPAGQANAYLLLGGREEVRGRYSEALCHAYKALELYRAADHRAGQARTLNAIGWYHALLGEHRQALTLCGQALTLHRELGDRKGEAHTLDSLGFAEYELGDRTRAAARYQQALDLFRDLGDRAGEATTLTHLGDQHSSTDPDAACRHWQQALEILDQLGNPGAELIRAKVGQALA